MELTALSFSALLGYLQQAIAGIVDPRRPSNGTRYSLQDVVLGAFSCFFMQSESFLEHQRQLNSRCGRDNAQTLFGLERIPTVEQMSNLLNGSAARHLFVVFEWIYRALNAQGYLRVFELLEYNLLVALDGTEYYRSEKIHCPCCSTRTHKDGKITYCHQSLLPAIVHLEQASVLSLLPEFITPQDGCGKQDCELNAAKRWVTSHAGLFEGQPVTLLGDDLFGHQPMCQHSLDHQFNFLFVLEHNFGHGQRHLAMVLLTLNLLAFLFHTVLEWVDERYLRARAQRGTRKGFFQDLLSLTKYLLFENWQHLLDFLLDDSGPRRAPYRANTS